MKLERPDQVEIISDDRFKTFNLKKLGAEDQEKYRDWINKLEESISEVAYERILKEDSESFEIVSNTAANYLNLMKAYAKLGLEIGLPVLHDHANDYKIINGIQKSIHYHLSPNQIKILQETSQNPFFKNLVGELEKCVENRDERHKLWRKLFNNQKELDLETVSENRILELFGEVFDGDEKLKSEFKTICNQIEIGAFDLALEMTMVRNTSLILGEIIIESKDLDDLQKFMKTDSFQNFSQEITKDIPDASKRYKLWLTLFDDSQNDMNLEPKLLDKFKNLFLKTFENNIEQKKNLNTICKHSLEKDFESTMDRIINRDEMLNLKDVSISSIELDSLSEIIKNPFFESLSKRIIDLNLDANERSDLWLDLFKIPVSETLNLSTEEKKELKRSKEAERKEAERKEMLKGQEKIEENEKIKNEIQRLKNIKGIDEIEEAQRLEKIDALEEIQRLNEIHELLKIEESDPNEKIKESWKKIKGSDQQERFKELWKTQKSIELQRFEKNEKLDENEKLEEIKRLFSEAFFDNKEQKELLNKIFEDKNLEGFELTLKKLRDRDDRLVFKDSQSTFLNLLIKDDPLKISSSNPSPEGNDSSSQDINSYKEKYRLYSMLMPHFTDFANYEVTKDNVFNSKDLKVVRKVSPGRPFSPLSIIDHIDRKSEKREEINEKSAPQIKEDHLDLTKNKSKIALFRTRMEFLGHSNLLLAQIYKLKQKDFERLQEIFKTEYGGDLKNDTDKQLIFKTLIDGGPMALPARNNLRKNKTKEKKDEIFKSMNENVFTYVDEPSEAEVRLIEGSPIYNHRLGAIRIARGGDFFDMIDTVGELHDLKPNAPEVIKQYVEQIEKFGLITAAGVSATTSRNLVTAVALGLLNTEDDLLNIREALIGHFVKSGHHSVLEVLYGSANIGINEVQELKISPLLHQLVNPLDSTFAEEVNRKFLNKCKIDFESQVRVLEFTFKIDHLNNDQKSTLKKAFQRLKKSNQEELLTVDNPLIKNSLPNKGDTSTKLEDKGSILINELHTLIFNDYLSEIEHHLNDDQKSTLKKAFQRLKKSSQEKLLAADNPLLKNSLPNKGDASTKLEDKGSILINELHKLIFNDYLSEIKHHLNDDQITVLNNAYEKLNHQEKSLLTCDSPVLENIIQKIKNSNSKERDINVSLLILSLRKKIFNPESKINKRPTQEKKTPQKQKSVKPPKINFTDYMTATVKRLSFVLGGGDSSKKNNLTSKKSNIMKRK